MLPLSDDVFRFFVKLGLDRLLDLEVREVASDVGVAFVFVMS